jgi:hypothetical protein
LSIVRIEGAPEAREAELRAVLERIEGIEICVGAWKPGDCEGVSLLFLDASLSPEPSSPRALARTARRSPSG